MGCVIKLINAVLFLFFLLIAIVVPLFDAQICLPQEYYPKALVDLSSWYSNDYGDYLIVEKPNFFVGLVWLELFVIWPLSIVNLFGLLCAKSWFNTTCLIYGASVTTSMVAILSELIRSSKASEKLLMVYYPFLGLSVLAVLRGLLPASCKTAVISKRPVPARKKKAWNLWCIQVLHLLHIREDTTPTFSFFLFTFTAALFCLQTVSYHILFC